MSDLAAQAQLSDSHFAQAFRQLTGWTPHQYLLLVRLSHARMLLTQKNEPISVSEIARACGFFDQAHLSRHFRRFFGTTPEAFSLSARALEQKSLSTVELLEFDIEAIPVQLLRPKAKAGHNVCERSLKPATTAIEIEREAPEISLHSQSAGVFFARLLGGHCAASLRES